MDDLLSVFLGLGAVGLPACFALKVGGGVGPAVDVLGDVGVALAVASGRSGDLRRAGCSHPAAHGRVVAEDKGVGALDQLSEALVDLGELVGVGVDGVGELVRLIGDAGGVEVEAGAAATSKPAVSKPVVKKVVVTPKPKTEESE